MLFRAVVPVLFKHSFKEDIMEEKVLSLDHIFSVEPMKITSSSSDAEIALALRVLEGCCLLHSESNILAHKYNAIQVHYLCFFILVWITLRVRKMRQVYDSFDC